MFMWRYQISTSHGERLVVLDSTCTVPTQLAQVEMQMSNFCRRLRAGIYRCSKLISPILIQEVSRNGVRVVSGGL